MSWLAVAALLGGASSIFAHEGATGVVRERMEAMEAMAKSMKSIDQHIKRKRDLAPVKAEAKSIQDGALKMPSLFPPETGKHPSEAKADVWKKWPDFEARARALATESAKLAELDGRDLKELREQAVRVSNVCGDCHELYRSKQHGH
jgi:cytochrome c556